MFFYTYILLSQKDYKFYIGYTPDDVFRRLAKHNNNEVPSTKERTPLVLIYYEAFLDQQDALRRERYLKHPKVEQQLNTCYETI